jgi:hypothetical protein
LAPRRSAIPARRVFATEGSPRKSLFFDVAVIVPGVSRINAETDQRLSAGVDRAVAPVGRDINHPAGLKALIAALAVGCLHHHQTLAAQSQVDFAGVDGGVIVALGHEPLFADQSRVEFADAVTTNKFKQGAVTPKAKTVDEPLVATGSIRKPIVEKPAAEPPKLAVVEPEPEPEEEPSKVEIGNLATTTDLTDILKKRAAEAAATAQIGVIPEAAAPTTPITLVPEPKIEPVVQVDPETTQPIEPATKKGRVPVQSWEEILLSTRSEEDQTN